MRVLVIGASGFAGRHAVAALRASGHAVVCGGRGRVSDPPTPGAKGEAAAAAGDIASEAEADSPTLGALLDTAPAASSSDLNCDVTRPESIALALAEAQADAVLLLAGMASPPAALADPPGAFSVHVLGAVNLLAEVARRGGRERVVWVGSSEMYGAVLPEENPVREHVRLRPATVYAASKAAADMAVRAVAFGRSLDVVRVRPFNHTGPGQRLDFVCPDFASQVVEIAEGRRAPVVEVGNIDVERDFADVRDIVRGYIAALERGRSGEAYNLCSGQPRSIRAILGELCAQAGIEPEIRVLPARWRPAEVPAYWGCAEKARAELGWRPEIPWSTTLGDLIAWVRAGHPDPDVR